MIVENVHLNQLYENKTNFYRKLDAVCDTIHEFKSMQDGLVQRGSETVEFYDRPDFNDFTKVHMVNDYDNDDSSLQLRQSKDW